MVQGGAQKNCIVQTLKRYNQINPYCFFVLLISRYLNIYIIKQNICIYLCCLQPAKRLDRLGYIFLWTLMGGRRVLQTKKIRNFLFFNIFFNFFFHGQRAGPFSQYQIQFTLNIQDKRLNSTFISFFFVCFLFTL